jgi:hypothetical protein
MFPYPKDTPAIRPKDSVHSLVPKFVTLQFVLPKCGVVSRHVSTFRAAMPEAAVNEDGQALTLEGEVRAAF